ncbi:hypothetical protein Tsubulata_015847 [Turnera subulata]|uniref:ATP-dependent Clp protease proteolytic subunit n=1 Tax=Turnera subulata TaxID=218843 RepID=A0A9Q0GFV0_9ROSI|nr:hypothetical protein Tsubulata_015847 [Turnera subulata]
MEIATVTSPAFGFRARMSASPPASRTEIPNRTLTFASSAAGPSLSTSTLSPLAGAGTDFSGTNLLTGHLNPASTSRSKARRSVVTMVTPFFTQLSMGKMQPPDLASFFFSKRIVYLGMPFVPEVTELTIGSLIYLDNDDSEEPIYLYINSTGTNKGDRRLGYESEALAIHDFMCTINTPIHTLCVGNAWGEAALLLAAGAKGKRAALPSANIMIKQPLGRFQGQTTDLEIARREMRHVSEAVVKLLSWHTGKSRDEIEADIIHPKYFTPSEAVEYGIIDQVLYTENAPEDQGVVAALRRAQLI